MIGSQSWSYWQERVAVVDQRDEQDPDHAAPHRSLASEDARSPDDDAGDHRERQIVVRRGLERGGAPPGARSGEDLPVWKLAVRGCMTAKR